MNHILKKHEEVFRGLVKLTGQQIKLNINESHTRKVQPQRRIPFHEREKVSVELKQLQRSDINKRVPITKATL